MISMYSRRRVAGFSNRDAGAIVLKGTTGKARLGNPPFYKVAGKRYVVRESAAGYSERGVASSSREGLLTLYPERAGEAV